MRLRRRNFFIKLACCSILFIFKIIRLWPCMLAGGMVRSCSLSRILIPGRQHVPKSVQVILCYANNKALSYHLIATTKEIASYMTHLTLRMETSILNPNNDISWYVNDIDETIPESNFEAFKHHLFIYTICFFRS